MPYDKQLHYIFRGFDKDHSGFINAEELYHALVILGMNVTQEEVKEYLPMIDSDGEITEEEFFDLMMGSPEENDEEPSSADET
jgi:Ca2+-binding EF-hand superfamily protein